MELLALSPDRLSDRPWVFLRFSSGEDLCQTPSTRWRFGRGFRGLHLWCLPWRGRSRCHECGRIHLCLGMDTDGPWKNSKKNTSLFEFRFEHRARLGQLEFRRFHTAAPWAYILLCIMFQIASICLQKRSRPPTASVCSALVDRQTIRASTLTISWNTSSRTL